MTAMHWKDGVCCQGIGHDGWQAQQIASVTMNIVPTLLNNESPWWLWEFCLLYFPLKFTGESKWILTLLDWWKGRLPQILQEVLTAWHTLRDLQSRAQFKNQDALGQGHLGSPCPGLDPLTGWALYHILYLTGSSSLSWKFHPIWGTSPLFSLCHAWTFHLLKMCSL